MTDTREDAREVARGSGLRYTSDTRAGFTRHKKMLVEAVLRYLQPV